jgi:DEAD/DEAH box helicase domain-containing protein
VGASGGGEMLTSTGETFDADAANARFQPSVFLYDNYPGGIGLSAPLYEMRARVVAQAEHMVATCPCRDGCPACIGPVTDVDTQADASRKALARDVLSLLAEAPGVWP